MTPSVDTPNELRRLKLLLVIDEMEVGGTQRQIVNMVHGLDHRRFVVTLLYFRHRSHLADEVERSGVFVRCIGRRHRFDVRFVLEIRTFLQREQFEVMHCFSYSGEFWAALARRLLPRSQRPALITSIRGTYEWYSTWQWSVKRWLTRQSIAVVANSRSGAEFAAAKMRIQPAALRVIYNSVEQPLVDSHAVVALRSALAGPDRPLVVFVGRLVDHKDLPTLLRAASRLSAITPRPMIVLAGDGPLRGELDRSIGERGLSEFVVLLGERADAATLIAAGDMLVLPSLREGLSNVILEAMIAGKPVIASRAGGNVELIDHGIDGVLFDIGDDAALADAIKQLTREPDLRNRFGRAAQVKAARDFGITAMIDALTDCYHIACRGPARRGRVPI